LNDEQTEKFPNRKLNVLNA